MVPMTVHPDARRFDGASSQRASRPKRRKASYMIGPGYRRLN